MICKFSEQGGRSWLCACQAQRVHSALIPVSNPAFCQWNAPSSYKSIVYPSRICVLNSESCCSCREHACISYELGRESFLHTQHGVCVVRQGQQCHSPKCCTPIECSICWIQPRSLSSTPGLRFAASAPTNPSSPSPTLATFPCGKASAVWPAMEDRFVSNVPPVSAAESLVNGSGGIQATTLPQASALEIWVISGGVYMSISAFFQKNLFKLQRVQSVQCRMVVGRLPVAQAVPRWWLM